MEQIALYMCRPKAKDHRESCCRFVHAGTHLEQRHGFLEYLSGKTGKDVSDGRIDPTRAYLARLPSG